MRLLLRNGSYYQDTRLLRWPRSPQHNARQAMAESVERVHSASREGDTWRLRGGDHFLHLPARQTTSASRTI